MSKIPRVVLGITIILFYASALCSDATFPPELRTTTYGIFNATVNSTGIFNATVNSTTGPPSARKPPASHTLRTVQVSLYAIVFAVGVTGNILVIATVASKRMRSVKNLLSGNLAVADLTTLVVCLPMIVVALFQGWPFGLDFCRYFFPLADV
ncbi:MAG: hypothetical protein GY776_16440, partial [Alteromonas sp.]|nr:hypothetical protein [Alteromonas sp.]